MPGEIAKLWNNQQGKSSSLRRSRLELEGIREKLGERPAKYKSLLKKTGRDGKWMAFSREINIPKTTAERYVAKWQTPKLPKQANRPNGAIHAPSTEEIDKLVAKIAAKVRSILITSESIAYFLTKLVVALPSSPPAP